MSTLLKSLVLSLFTVGMSLASAGTFSADWNNAPSGVSGIPTLTDEQYGSLDDNRDNVNGVFLKATTGPLESQTSTSFYIAWHPSKPNEHAPTYADVTLEIDGSISGAPGSNGSIRSGRSTLLNSLRAERDYIPLRTVTLRVGLARDTDGSATGFLRVPLDTLSASRGALICERATVTTIAAFPFGQVTRLAPSRVGGRTALGTMAAVRQIDLAKPLGGRLVLTLGTVLLVGLIGTGSAFLRAKRT